MAKLVSKVYGEALFEAAIEAGTVDSLMEEVDAVLAIFRANEEYIKLLNHPKIPVEEKVALLEEAFKGKASNQLVGLLTATVEKGRFAPSFLIFYFTSWIFDNSFAMFPSCVRILPSTTLSPICMTMPPISDAST